MLHKIINFLIYTLSQAKVVFLFKKGKETNQTLFDYDSNLIRTEPKKNPTKKTSKSFLTNFYCQALLEIIAFLKLIK